MTVRGLPEGDLAVVRSVLGAVPQVERAVLFGSRAKGTAKTGSDVDLAVWGANWTTVARLTAQLQDEGPLPYFFDVVAYETTTTPALKDHIDRVGLEIYRRPCRLWTKDKRLAEVAGELGVAWTRPPGFP